MKDTKATWVFGACIGVLLVACGVSALRLVEARAAAQDAQENLGRIEDLAERVEELRKLQDRALVQGQQQIESSQTWIEQARTAGIGEQQITEINRLPLQKLKSSNYSRRDVVLRIGGVTAEQIARFLLRCDETAIGYHATSIHMRKVQGNTEPIDRWSAELILTRLLYTATNQTPGK